MEKFCAFWQKVWQKICAGCLVWWNAHKTGGIWIGRKCAAFGKACALLWREHLKAPVMKALRLHWLLTLLLVIASVVLLLYAFCVPDANFIITYVGYALSAYTTVVVCMKVPGVCKKVKRGLYANQYSSRLLTDEELRAKISLYASFGINLFYAVFKFLAGVHFKSTWLGGLAVYYIMLSLMRFALIKRYRYHLKYEDEREQRLFGLKSYRVCGILMFLLNIAVSGLVVQLVWKNETYAYPGYLIYVFAGYAFYCVGIAIRNMAKHRKLEQPVMAAAKMLSFACALVAILATQTAMLTQFGNGQETFARIMNGVTGTAVCLLIFGLAVWMVRRANKEMKRMEE